MRSRWLTRRDLNAILNDLFPESVQCFAYRFADAHRWSACTATQYADVWRGRDGLAYPPGVYGWVSAETYPTHWQAVCAAYQRARRDVPLPAYRGYCPN